MESHEKLKLICDKIWYNTSFWFQTEEEDEYNEFTWYYKYYKWPWYTRQVNVIEIIFTPEFIEKMNKFYLIILDKKAKSQEESLWLITNYLLWYFSHLDDPVEYLYNLIK